jgi:hypothetical protein
VHRLGEHRRAAGDRGRHELGDRDQITNAGSSVGALTIAATGI